MKVVAGAGVRITCREEIAELLAVLLESTERQFGYSVRPSTTGCFACRPIRGTNIASNHSWGLAVDINWDLNPMGTTFQTDMPPGMPEMWWDCGFFWGGWYQKRPDTMHYEYVFRPADVDGHLSKARAHLAKSPAWEDPVTAEPGSREIRFLSVGSDVDAVQRLLGIPVNGQFDLRTKVAVTKYQKARDLYVDGIVGKQTWASMLADLAG